MKKMLLVVGSLMLSMVVLFGFSESASAASSSVYFETDNIESSQSIYVSSGRTVTVKINSCSRVNWSSFKKDSMSVSQCGPAISVNLTSVSTGNSTSTKVVGSDGYVTFTNMVGGTYYVHFYDSWSSYFFSGWSTVSR
ncbi:hypothetical protein COE15_25150 [Bacillus cereus]|uniref:hypothetical protein n=1 Tax=Bacillus sp. AFS023182 TaxID=2033492 RepID=UPI000BF6A06E|nr:hypothetical protein [Bacillus sp. AFS023182]PFE04544.1 hypothetical protein CN288_07985 [Bacillus sp. AFS023182]PGX91574.1 hypothetical protein COE15_25150 [Bacillus cereus]